MDAERLGQQLRDAREAQELTLEQVEQTLRIRARYLEAFEAGAYEDLPGAVQARGFLRNYARFLRLDEGAVLAQFDAVRGAGQRHRMVPGWRSQSATAVVAPAAALTEHTETTPRSGQGRRLAIILGGLLGVVVLMAMCFGGTQVLDRLLNADANREGPDLLSILPTVPSLTPSATFLPSMTPLPGQQVVSGATPITDRVVLQITVVERAYIRVTADGTQIFEGVVRPGTGLQYQAQQELTIQSSSGAALDVVFNNIPIGLLGLRGEAITTTFTPDLVLTPTPNEAPTATFTLAPPPTVEGGEGNGSDEITPDAGGSGKAGQVDGNVPTALPLPDQASDVVGSTPTVVATVGDAQVQATALPAIAPTQLPPTQTPTETATSTATSMPTATVTPSPTAILPPRLTSTPIPEK